MSVTGADAFVGRGSALDDLAGALARHRGSRLVLVAGEAGVGKTRLVSEAIASTATPSLWAVCWEGDGAPAFWPWIQIVRAARTTSGGSRWEAGGNPAVDEVLSLLPEAQPSPHGDASRFRLFDAITELVRSAAGGERLAIVLDDLQWCDEPSLRLLAFLVRAVRTDDICVLATYRPDDVARDHPLPATMADLAGHARHLTLAGLTTDELAELVALELGRDEPGIAVDLHRVTGGNPFFAREVLALVRDDPARHRGRIPLPAGVRAVVDQRLARLPNDCHDVLQVAAVIGPIAAVDVLARAMDRDADHVLGALEPAFAAGVVTSDPETGAVCFAHDLVRETLYDGLGSLTRVRTHAAVAAAVEHGGVGDDAVAARAHHLLAAVASVGWERAADAAVEAGDRALAVMADEEAAGWYERALALLRAASDEARTVGALLALGEARRRAGDLPAARAAFVEAADRARRTGRSDDLARAALGLGGGLGGFEVALFDRVQIDLLREALAVLEGGDSGLRVQLLARLSVALSFVAAEDERVELAAEAVDMARRMADRRALGYALAARCDAIPGPADATSRRDAASEIVAIGETLGDLRLELLGRRLLVVALLELGDVAGVDEQIKAFAAAAEVVREPLYRWYVPLWRGMRALMAGRFAECDELCEEAAALGEMADSDNARMLSLTLQWVRLRAERRWEDAAALVSGVDDDVFGDVSGSLTFRALGHLHGGDAGAAADALHHVMRLFDRLPPDSEWLPTVAQAAELAAALGDREAAGVVDAALAPFDDLFVIEGIGAALCGQVSAYRAPLAELLGRHDEAARLRSQAAEAAARIGLVAGPVPGGRVRPEVATAGAASASVRREDDVWAWTFEGTTARLRDAKGLRDLAVLVGRPGTAVHVSELVTTDPGAQAVLVTAGAGDEVLDRRAIAAYRQRLVDLDDELAEAEAHHDDGRVDKLREERDFLLAEMSAAVGLGGRGRRTGDDVDKARKAVRARVRDAIARIEAAHPALGRHLDHAVRTGVWCTYDPEVPVEWTVG